ncbi:Metal homeostatis protein BSD2 [Cyphellophora attinorum]|uniref:Metal homeostatis protein BSD2 n=1 Tax=Cyphellophora attinorum TaxID=1664694 RepID=A0A0N1HZU5_9EURO|nr:Metal homeostatis protein BSD2 [Phialophora attinorum]KPI44460.1 Metal homeostatis protein BSD2 [Phialophora attinorum]
MSSQRYQPVNAHDDDNDSPIEPSGNAYSPTSPPPSFRSRDTSPTSRRLLDQEDPMTTDASRDLEDTFGDGSDDEEDDRQRLMRGNPDTPQTTRTPTSSSTTEPRQQVERRITELPAFRPPTTRPQPNAQANDGVFANLGAKLERGEQVDEKPPTYEQAAADATPPYWETTILAPGMSSDEVYVEGLPVGSLFSFLWNGMISFSFQLVGFLLTYLLHTTHAAKNGSRAGLGLTLVQYGFYMRSNPDSNQGNPGQFANGSPPDPNSHSFDPNNVDNTGPGSGPDTDLSGGGLTGVDWVSYVLMIVGWFILIRAVSDFLRARKAEQLISSSPSRGLPVPVVAEGESPERAA